MKNKKKIEEQTIVITGASSGIGLATAYLAAEKGARVVLASRNKEDLKEICKKIEDDGGTATFVKADVSKEEDVREIAEHAINTYGGFDSWVNNAGVGLFGSLMDIPIEDERRLFEVNYWGVIYGSQTALDHLRKKGGTIINMGSILSDRALPLQGTYSASKHAVKAFTDALRTEVEKEKTPVNVITLKPGSINSPFVEHARNWLNSEPKLPPPYHDPYVVARAIVQCCTTYHRDVNIANLGGFPILQMEHLMPGTLDKIMKWKAFDLQKKMGDHKMEEGNLYDPPAQEGQIRGDYEGHVFKHDLTSDAFLDPKKLLAAATVGFSALLWLGFGSSNNQ